jgi:hypothetical protein
MYTDEAHTRVFVSMTPLKTSSRAAYQQHNESPMRAWHVWNWLRLEVATVTQDSLVHCCVLAIVSMWVKRSKGACPHVEAC